MNYPPDRITPGYVDHLAANEVFVFGSNLQGNHAGGAARLALRWGAEPGKGTGMAGQTCAIPTMFRHPGCIREYVSGFISFARNHPERRFLVTEIGCGIAGFTPADIAPLFSDALPVGNICLPVRFWEWLMKHGPGVMPV